jgi:hypothetical protein
MAVLKEWVNERTGAVIARVTDVGFHINGGARFSGITDPLGGVAECWGQTDAEGIAFIEQEEESVALTGQLFVNWQAPLPQGALVYACHARMYDAAFGGGTSVAVGVGPAATPAKYINMTPIPDFPDVIAPVLFPNGWTPLAGDEQLRVNACTAAGAMGDTPWASGTCRCRAYYMIPRDLLEY